MTNACRIRTALVAKKITEFLKKTGRQVLFKPVLIDKLIAAFDPERSALVVVPSINGRRGNPVVWSRRFFNDLMAINGDIGARHLIGSYAEVVAEVPVAGEAALTDVDTPESLSAVKAEIERA